MKLVLISALVLASAVPTFATPKPQQPQQDQEQGQQQKATGVGIGVGISDAEAEASSTARSRSNSNASIVDKSVDLNSNVNKNSQDLTNNNANIGIQGQKTDVDTDVNNADVNLNKAGDQTQLGIQGQKNTQLGVQDASTKSGNVNQIDASHTDNSKYDARSFSRTNVDSNPAAPSAGSTIKYQTLVCNPDGKTVILTDEVIVPEHRTGFNIGADGGFFWGFKLSHYNAGRLHKSMQPQVNLAIKGQHEERIKRLSPYVNDNPLAMMSIGWNIQDRHTAGLKDKSEIANAKLKSAAELATLETHVKQGGSLDITGCYSQ